MNFPLHANDDLERALAASRADWRPGAVGGGGASGIEPRLLLRRVLEQRALILGVLVGGLILAGLYLFTATPHYSAQSLILLGSRTADATDPQASRTPERADEQAVESEIEVLRSGSIGGLVIERLALEGDPEFNESLRRPGFLSWLLSLPRAWFDAPSPAVDAEWRQARVVEAFNDKLSVYQRGASRVVAIEFSSRDAAKAQRVANALAEAYVEDQISAKVAAHRRAAQWLLAQIEVLRRSVQDSEAAVERYREERGLLRGSEATLNAQALSSFNGQVTDARAARAAIEARLVLVRNLLKSPGGVDSAAEVLQSPLIQKLKEQEVQLQRRIAELSIKLLPRNPELLRAEAELSDLRGRIRTEIDKIVEGLRNEAEIARNREASLQTELNRLKSVAAKGNQSEVRLRALEREAAANRGLLEGFLSRFKEVTAREDTLVQSPDSRIISQALLPTEPNSPSAPPLLLLAAFASLLLGLLVAFLRSLLATGYRETETLEEATGLPILGSVPRIARGATAPQIGGALREVAPNDPYEEALRSLHASLLLGEGGRLPRRILVTSALEGEGKTALALNLARLLALGGQKVALIDGNLRNPGVHRAAGIEKGPGLAECLSGETQASAAMFNEPGTGLAILQAGRSIVNPPASLAGKAFTQFLNRSIKSYDAVIIDSPALLDVSDARILSSKADLTVMLVRFGKTSRSSVGRALGLITTAGGRCGGLVLSMTEQPSHGSRLPFALLRQWRNALRPAAIE